MMFTIIILLHESKEVNKIKIGFNIIKLNVLGIFLSFNCALQI